MGLLEPIDDGLYRPTALGMRLLPACVLHHFARQEKLPEQFPELEGAVVDRTVLDAGCGVGAYSLLFHRLGARTVVAMDRAAEQLAIARSFAGGRQGTIRFLRGSVESLPLPDGSIDFLFCRLVLPYAKKSRALAEFSRVLVPGGQALLMLHGPGYYFAELLRIHVRPAHLKAMTLGLLGLLGGLAVDLLGKGPRWWAPRGSFYEAYDRPTRFERLARSQGLQLRSWERQMAKPYAWLRKPLNGEGSDLA